MVEDNFQQKKEKILAWFQQNELDAENPQHPWSKDTKSTMLQENFIQSSLKNSSNIENSLFHENNKILEEPLSQLSENTLEHQASKRKNRQPGSQGL